MERVIKSFADIEQCWMLSEFLSLETADCYHAVDVGIVVTSPYITKTDDETLVPGYKGAIPCWSLSALLDILSQRTCVYKKEYMDGRVMYQGVLNGSKDFFQAENPVDVCVEMLLKLNGVNKKEQ